MTATLGRLGLLEARLLLVAGVTNRIRLLWVRNILRADGSRAAVPVDLTGWNPRLQLRRDGKVLADLSDCVTLDSHGHVDVSVTDERSSTLMPCAGAWDLLLESPQGDRIRRMGGRQRHQQKGALMIRTLDGCSCDEGPVIILEDAIIGDVSIVYATDADIDNLFPTPTTDKEEHDG